MRVRLCVPDAAALAAAPHLAVPAGLDAALVIAPTGSAPPFPTSIAPFACDAAGLQLRWPF